MKNQKLKMIFHLIISIVISFFFIYLMIFIGGWRLLESGDPILIELAFSVIFGILLWIIIELYLYCEAKFKELNKKIDELEKYIDELKRD